MRRLNYAGTQPALESQPQIPVVVIDPAQDIALEEARLEAMTSMVESGERVMVALEELRLVSSTIEGGLSPDAAKILSVAANGLAAQVGYVRPIVPALESFEGEGRVSATQLALEGLGNAIKSVWEAIVAALKRFVDWIRNFFGGAAPAADALEKRADETKKKVLLLTYDAPPKKPEAPVHNALGDWKSRRAGGMGLEDNSAGHSNSRLSKALWTTKGVANIDVVNATVKGMEDAAKMGHDMVKEMSQTNFDDISPEALDGKEKLNLEDFAMPIGFFGSMNGFETVSHAADHVAGDTAGMRLKRGPELLGGKATFVFMPEAGKGRELLEHYSRSDIWVGNFDPKKSADGSEPLPEMSKDQLAHMCDLAKRLAQAANKYFEIQPTALSCLDKMTKGSEKMMKIAESKDLISAQDSHLLARFMQQNTKLVSKALAPETAYIISTAKAMLDFVDHCMGAVNTSNAAAR